MRGPVNPQNPLFCYTNPEDRIPQDHPLRRIKAYADRVLKEMSPLFARMYSAVGRPSIPPERLLKSQLLIALYSVRSDRQFCEQLRYNLLFQWFLDMSLEDAAFDFSTFSQNRERLLRHDAAHRFFEGVVRQARRENLLADDRFSVDGTLIEAWASLKSFQPREGNPAPQPPDDPGNPSVNFRGEKRSNRTHQSTTDPETRLMRKSNGVAAKLSFSGHVLMENRNGLCVDLAVREATTRAETETAWEMVARQLRRRIRVRSVGADKGYHTARFIGRLRQSGVAPHVAPIRTRKIPGLDGRTLRQVSYALSQKARKRTEEIFGWMKTIGGLRKTRFRGIARTQQFAHIVAATYNLLRMSRLVTAEAVT